MNAGDMYPLFASMLTQRPWDEVTRRSLRHLSMPGTNEVCSSMHLDPFYPTIATDRGLAWIFLSTVVCACMPYCVHRMLYQALLVISGAWVRAM